MSDKADENIAINQVACEMFERDGADAMSIAREHADVEGRLGNTEAAVRWRFIANAIEQIQTASEPD